MTADAIHSLLPVLALTRGPESPDVTPAAPRTAPTEAGPLPVATVSAEKLRVLIVDDERLNLRILGRILEGEGYAVTPAASGEEALELFRAAPCHLILLDVLMPGIDGFATCREFKREYGNACPPVIFVTALDTADDIVAGFEAGGTDYLPKPYRSREVIARVRTHLQNQLFAIQQKQLVAQLSAANAAKNRFLGMAAHDLRNPLTAIRALSEFLREDRAAPLNPSQLELADTIHSASETMLRMVNELLDVTTIEAGVVKLTRRKCLLGSLVRDSAKLQNIDATRKASHIEVTDSGEVEIEADAEKLRQVVDNLLSNAVKYSPRGSVINVAVFSSKTRAGFSVRDLGPGVPEGERHKLFTDFGRLSAQPTAGESSTGLGLAICRKIVDAHQGTIEAVNLPERGCEFRVTLPCP